MAVPFKLPQEALLIVLKNPILSASAILLPSRLPFVNTGLQSLREKKDIYIFWPCVCIATKCFGFKVIFVHLGPI